MTAASSQIDSADRVQIAVSVETLAYAALLIAAFALRFIGLGDTLLSEVEARQALAAHNLLTTGAVAPGVIESPVTLAALVASFAVAGPLEGTARFLPMVAGMALVISPQLFRERLGRLPTLITSTLIALSPTAVAASRTVGGYSFAMLGLVLALWAFDRFDRTNRARWLVAVGTALGVTLLADYAALAAVAAVLIGTAFALSTRERTEIDSPQPNPFAAVSWRVLLISLLATLVIISTLFSLTPDGLGAAADLLGRFVRGLATREPGVTWLGFGLGIYELGLLTLGLIGTWIASQSEETWKRFLAGWAFVSLVFSVVYPGALPGHGVWAVVPLAALAALVITQIFALEHQAPRWASWAHALGVVGLVGASLISLFLHLYTHQMITLAIPVGPTAGETLVTLPIYLIMAAVWIVAQAVPWLLVATMWEPRTAVQGMGLGVVVLHLLGAIGASAALAFARASSPYEPFNVAPAQPGLALLVDTARDMSAIAEGQPLDAPITVQASDQGALAWALRDFNRVTFVSHADPTVSSVMVITPADGADPALGSTYVGQDFVIVRQWYPVGLTLEGLAKWIFYREPGVPAQEMRVILWVRDDVYRLVPASGSR